MNIYPRNKNVSIICACDEQGGIGKNGAIPWHLNSQDMKNFVRCTRGSIVVMGRKTLESLPETLEDRKTVVLSRNPHYAAPDVEVVHSFSELFDTYGTSRPIWICGGHDIYEEGLNYASSIFYTQIQGVYDCDVFFPKVRLTDWRERVEQTRHWYSMSEHEPTAIMKVFERD